MDRLENVSEKSIKRRRLVEGGQTLPFVKDLFAVPPFFKDMEFRPIQTIEELKAASKLVYEEYVKLGYIDPNAAQFKFSIYQTIPTTTTFVAVYRKSHVLGTLTVIQDSPLGLPMDQLYKSELDALRTQGRHLFEATMFSFNDKPGKALGFSCSRGDQLLMVLNLFKGAFDYLRGSTSADELVGCWHPRHEILYQFMQMKPLGGLKSYARVKGSPALARHLNVREGEERAMEIASMKFFFGQVPPPKENFAPKPRFSLKDLDSLYVRSSYKGTPPQQPSGLPSAIEQVLKVSSTLPNPIKKLPVRFDWNNGVLRVLMLHRPENNLFSSLASLGCLLESIRIAAASKQLQTSCYFSVPKDQKSLAATVSFQLQLSPSDENFNSILKTKSGASQLLTECAPSETQLERIRREVFSFDGVRFLYLPPGIACLTIPRGVIKSAVEAGSCLMWISCYLTSQGLSIELVKHEEILPSLKEAFQSSDNEIPLILFRIGKRAAL